MTARLCPLCGQRKARRQCPALGQEICSVCCGTKRLTEIRCPSDCTYLVVAREHPPAAIVRQQQRDVELLLNFVRDFSQRQSQLFATTVSFLAGYVPPEFHALRDDDVAEAAEALAATFETASRGVIYEHRPASIAAERLVAALKPLLDDAGQRGGTAFERDAAVVMRRLKQAVGESNALAPDNRRAFLDLLGRTMRKSDPTKSERPATPGSPHLIVP